tara:strand:+ start:1199 stop:2059 length:861 start_codon:yes stop_codon:yes gene_type:complete
MLDDIKQDYEFPTEMVELEALNRTDNFGNQNYSVPPDMARACVRTDTGQVLGIHGSKYKPIAHKDVVDKVMQGVEKTGMFDYKTDIKVFEGGAKMRGSVTFENLVIEPQKDDIIKFRINFFNSYDQSWAFATICDGLRLWCMNGCTTPVNASTLRFKHTTKVNIQSITDRVKTGIDFFMDSGVEYNQWAKIRLTNHSVQKFLEQTVAKTFKRSSNSIPFNVTRTETLLEGFDRESRTLGNTKWALYNALTYWSTHTDGERGHAIRKRREDEVAKALGSKQWQELVA